MTGRPTDVDLLKRALELVGKWQRTCPKPFTATHIDEAVKLYGERDALLRDATPPDPVECILEFLAEKTVGYGGWYQVHADALPILRARLAAASLGERATEGKS